MKSISIFWRNKSNYYELVISECLQCGRKAIFKRFKCPYCGSSNLRYIRSKGYGVIREYTVSYYRGTENLEAYPRIIALVELDEGVKVVGEVVDVDINEVKVGMCVEAVLRRISSDDPNGIIYYALKFIPALRK